LIIRSDAWIDADVIRFFFKLILCVLLALAAGFVYLATRSGDPVYTFYEWISPARFQQYDKLIQAVATEHHLDPMLLKALVWRESRFDPRSPALPYLCASKRLSRHTTALINIGST